MRRRLILIGLIFLAIFTRFLGNNYDQLTHQHPDERWLVMLMDRLDFPSQLDPDFFAYGSLPIYILKAATQASDTLFRTAYDTYDGRVIFSRAMISWVDMVVAGLIGLLVWQLWGKRAPALLAVLSYLLMPFPTQNSNFFTVDPFVNLWALGLAVGLVSFWRKTHPGWLLFIGLMSGALLATKVSGVLLLPAVWLAILARTWMIQRRSLGVRLLTLFNHWGIVSLTTFATFVVSMPYALIKFEQFWREVQAQLVMNQDPFVFPYTLQYVATTPYLYYLKNIWWWGTGPAVSLAAIIGAGWLVAKLVKQVWRHPSTLLQAPAVWIGLMYLSYFLVIGRSAVKFMRYMLPLYPMLAVLAAVGLAAILSTQFLNWRLRRLLVLLILAGMALGQVSFLSIYLKPHTRVAASEWMLQNIPAGSSLAVEHWDDRLPIMASEGFEFIELAIYEQPDDATKWQVLNEKLSQADYLILASNRLYTPLQKLTDCQAYPRRCYPLTAQHYQRLLSGQSEWRLVADFSSFPTLPLINWPIDDTNADESFTVYDHPRVMIFGR